MREKGGVQAGAARPQAPEKYSTYWSARVRNIELICRGVVRAAAHIASRVPACARVNSRDSLSEIPACGATFTNIPGNMQSCVSTS